MCSIYSRSYYKLGTRINYLLKKYEFILEFVMMRVSIVIGWRSSYQYYLLIFHPETNKCLRERKRKLNQVWKINEAVESILFRFKLYWTNRSLNRQFEQQHHFSVLGKVLPYAWILFCFLYYGNETKKKNGQTFA